MKRRLIIVILIFSTILAVGCSNTAINDTPETPAVNNSGETLSLKIGLMPAVDAAPMFIAEQEGYFEELNLDVEFIVFNSGQERQSALQTNTVDGSITDLIAVATNVNSGFDLKATIMTQGMFPVLVRPGFENAEDIKATMMEVSVTNFLIDEWLEEDHNIEKVFINEIPARLEMVKGGNVDMGIFPEPMASMGALDGLEKKVYEMEDGYSPDVLAFTTKALEEKSEAIELFHEAYNKAVESINVDETIARDILIEKLNLNEAIRDSIILPEYTKASLPDDEYLQNIINWVENVLNKEMDISPEDLVEGKFTSND